MAVFTDLTQGRLTFMHDKFMSDYVSTYGILSDSAARGLCLLQMLRSSLFRLR